MSETGTPQTASPQKGSLLKAGGIGAAGGAGISTALFSTLGVGKLLECPTGFSPGYPIAILGAVALFVLVAGVASLPQTTAKGHLPLIFAGAAVFALLTLGGAYVFFYQVAYQPTITIVQRFQPSPLDFKDPDGSEPVKLQLMYYPPHARDGQQVEFKDGPQLVGAGDVLELNLNGLEKLESKYRQAVGNLGAARKQLVTKLAALQKVCGASATGVCILVNAQMQDFGHD